jgi:heavy metal sensor kinase
VRSLRRLLRRTSSIRVRLTLWYVALLAGMLLAFSGLLYVSLSRSLSQELDLTLSTEATRLIATMDFETGAPQLGGEGPDNLRIGTVAALYDSSGRHLLAYDPRQPLPILPDALVRAAQGRQTFTTAALADGTEWRVMTTPVTENGIQIGILQVGRPVAEVSATLHQLALLLALAVPFTLLLASTGGLFLAARALDPIDRITRAAAAIGADDLSRRLNFRTRDEVGRLAATFDRMLDRLERAFRRQRQFTADASHELRTPLTMLASQIDVALERERTPEEYIELLQSLREDGGRMAQLVSELLTLARADAGQQLLTREELDLGELVRSVAEAMQPLATQRGVQLNEDVTQRVSVMGDQTRLTQLVINLVDNALRYTSPGGTVTVAVTGDAGWATLRVQDTGIGIAAEHLPHLFERFYRADPARARTDGGAGLGLAIAQWITQAHGGQIAVDSTLGQGTTFSVRIPGVQVVATPAASAKERVAAR